MSSLTCCSSFCVCRVIIAQLKGAKCAFGSDGSADGWYSQGPKDLVARQVLSFDPSPTYSFEANELEGYEANLSEGDSEFDSDIDSHDEML